MRTPAPWLQTGPLDGIITSIMMKAQATSGVRAPKRNSRHYRTKDYCFQKAKTLASMQLSKALANMTVSPLTVRLMQALDRCVFQGMRG